MKLRRLLKPVAAPVLARFAQYFVPRAEFEHQLALQREQLLLEKTALADSFRRDVEDLMRRDADRRLEWEALCSQVGDQHAHFDARMAGLEGRTVECEARMTGLEGRTAECEARMTGFEGRTVECEARMTGFEARATSLERGAGWDRQALHDLACGALRAIGGSPSRTVSIGVVVPTCDRPALLARALQSLALQTRIPEMVVVVNDGKADVDSVIDQFADRLNIRSLRTQAPRSGSSVARNVALDALTTPLVAFLDDDNLMWPRWLERVEDLFAGDPTLDIVYGAQLRDVEGTVADKQWFSEPFDLSRLLKGNFIDLNQVVHRTSAVRFDPALRRLVDWDYLLRLIGDSPDRIASANPIASVYLTDDQDRISVIHWPPDLNDVMGHRRVGDVLALPGDQNFCSCCGMASQFLPGPNRRPRAACAHCGSLERHRFLQLLGPMMRSFWVPETRPAHKAAMLEIAPSTATWRFRALYGVATTIDADPGADGRVVDVVASLTDLPLRTSTIDLALVLHVLEHIPDDERAMREIGRILRPTGVAILQVPLSGRSVTDEEILHSAQERVMRYGQADHVRLYGDDFMVRLRDAGLTAQAVSPRESMPAEVVRKHALAADQALVFAVRADSPHAVRQLSAFVTNLRKGLL